MPTVENLVALRDALSAVLLRFDLPASDDARSTQRELLDQLDDYLIPRIRQLDAPLLAVLGGSTGAGKSSITNALVGREVTLPGVLRPTTRTPVLVSNPADREWFEAGGAENGVLSDLPRTTGEQPTSGRGVHLVAADDMPPGLAILDAPDIDSVETENHELAGQLLGAADLWLFVTTAARYADAVPWAYLARARERSIALAIIINRLPPGAAEEVRSHFLSMLTDQGLVADHVFTVDESAPGTGGPSDAHIAPIREWLHTLAADADARRDTVRRSLEGAVGSIEPRAERVAAAVDAQHHVAASLQEVAARNYGLALARVDERMTGGNVLRGEVLGQWQEVVGTGAFMSNLQSGVSRLRDRLRSVVRGGGVDPAEVHGELGANVAAIVRSAIDEAALATVEGWEALPGGADALEPAPRSIERAANGAEQKIDQAVAEWQAAVFDLVRELAGSKLNLARTLTFGINSVGVAAMVAIFSSTGGITGGEAAVAGGTAAVSQTILSAIFGDQAIRDLVALSRDDLRNRLNLILDDDRARFDDLVAGEADMTAERLRDAAAAAATLNV